MIYLDGFMAIGAFESHKFCFLMCHSWRKGISSSVFSSPATFHNVLGPSPVVPLPKHHLCRAPACFLQAKTKRSRATAAAAAENQVVGFAIAALSSFFNGSFPVCQRIPKGPALDPVVFNGLVCVGVFLSSLLVPWFFKLDFVFTLPGALGGVLFVFAALFSFVAIPRAGLATAQAVWSCSAILVSFAWGAIGPAEVAAPVGNIPATIAAVVLLVAGHSVPLRNGLSMFLQIQQSWHMVDKTSKDHVTCASESQVHGFMAGTGALVIVNCEIIAGRMSGQQQSGPRETVGSVSGQRV